MKKKTYVVKLKTRKDLRKSKSKEYLKAVNSKVVAREYTPLQKAIAFLKAWDACGMEVEQGMEIWLSRGKK